MINIINKNSYEDRIKCFGCRACERVCPFNAISMVYDDEGFIYPEINLEKCVQCDKCDKVCPDNIINKNNPSDKAIACYSEDLITRNNGSSGGIFELLATKFINEGGVVFGAAFDDKLNLRHKDVKCYEELKPILKSKYLQSDIGDSYKLVKSILDKGDKVLFSGTPCQISAIKNYLSKDYDNLLLIDLICHGVPSNKMFHKYIAYEEKRRKANIIDFSFRVKDGKISNNHGYSYKYSKGKRIKVHKGMYYDNPFYSGFQKYLFLRPSCYYCKYASSERVSDLTLGDFWGIKDHLPGIDADKGVSLVLINTQKGYESFNAIKDKIFYKEFAVDIAAKNNGCLTNPTRMPIGFDKRAEMAKDMDELPYKIFVMKHNIISRRRFIYAIYYRMPERLKKIIKRFAKGYKYE